MPLTRAEKEQVVERLAKRLRSAEAVVLSDYRGLNVAQITSLRRKLLESGSEITVAKNSLVKLALADAGLEPIDDLLVGPTAVTFLYEDVASPTKALRQAAKETQLLSIKGGLMGGRRLSAAAVESLADLPSRDELLALFLGVLQAPQRNLVTVLGAPLRDFLGVLNAKAATPAQGDTA